MVFVVAFFACLAVLAHFTSKTVIDKPLQDARARRSPVAELVDDLQNHRWLVIAVLASLVAIDKHFQLSGGVLQSRLVLAAAMTTLFLIRLVLRRSAAQSKESAK